ncbi:cytochrome P450 [Artemisia annua]|uniref:Cytochrome P450 n=1 Tax=Artemisia annua TaxID=35608 RepID=A0A2U1MQX8_ARTAN|nr:cytochrome P450 [Artemisia annua]
MRKLLVSEFLGPERARLSKHVLVTEIDNMVSSLSSNPSNVSNYREQPLKGPSWEMLDETMEILNGSTGDSFPWLGLFIDQFSGWNAKLKKCSRNLDAYIETIVDEHYNHTIKEISEDDKDFVHTLVELSATENASGYRLTT